MEKIPRILTKEQAEAEYKHVPSVGPEELAKRKDDLQEAAEIAGADAGVIPEKALKPDPELRNIFQQMHDPMEVPNAQPEFDYCWVYTGLHGQQIWTKKSMMMSGMSSTWHVVQGEMPEAGDYKHEDTTRRIGDVILMRILKTDHAILLQNFEYRRQLQELGVIGDLRELGDKYRSKGFIVHTDGDSRFASGKESVMDTVKRRAAAGHGMKAVGKMAREGNIPGIPAPGKGGG